MWLARQGGKCHCHLGEARADIGGHGPAAAAVVLVPCISLGDGEAEVPFDPGEGRVAYPVCADLLGGYPGEMAAEAPPEVVVASGGDGSAVWVPEEPLAGFQPAPGLAVGDEVRHQRGGNWLPALLLPKTSSMLAGAVIRVGRRCM